MAAKKKKKAKKVSPGLKLTETQAEALKHVPDKQFDVSGIHHKTQQALIDRGLATSNTTGKMIKLTAKGRKTLRSL